MVKERSDSWSKIETDNEAFISRKTVDPSTFDYGSVIPQRYHKAFLENLSENLSRGQQISITLYVNEKKFEASINCPNLNRKDTVIRLSFDKKFKEYLSKELNVSYAYIVNIKNQGISKGKNIKVPDEFKEYMDFYIGPEKNTFIVKLIKKNTPDSDNIDTSEESDEEDILDPDEELNEDNLITDYNVNEVIDHIYNYITNQGYTYKKELIKNLYISLKTKPFVILSGISGTGKSKIAELFAAALGATTENKRFNLIPVKPDWSDSTDLLGYRNIEGKFTSGDFLEIAYNAVLNPDKPYFICLDEMNLARVEYYFSDILSKMETRRFNEEHEIVSDYLLTKAQIGRDAASFSTYGDVYIPQNLYIIGTVNMDETTFPFSKKVLDRANTIEFNEVNLSYDFDAFMNDDTNEVTEQKYYHNNFLKSDFLKIRDCYEYKDIASHTIEKLIPINNILEKYNNHFGYRVRDEVVFYMIYALRDDLMTFEEAFDLCMVQKILPKISGSNNDTMIILEELFELINDYKIQNKSILEYDELEQMRKFVEGADAEISNKKYINTNKKLIQMMRRYIQDGFTTFWQ